MTEILTITAFFDSKEEAARAVERLAGAGVSRPSLRLASGRLDGDGPHEESRSLSDLALDYVLPEPERARYSEGIARGSTLVCARDVPRDLHETVVALLEEEGAVDIEERALEWQRRGEGPVPRELRGTTRDVAWTDPHQDDRRKVDDEGASVGAALGPEAGRPERVGGPASEGDSRSRRRVRSWLHTGP
ncbi:hypothetical protein [Cereibacter sphaeroides]|uniref:hypothetical protein n=1 Tax=Cereibacter sphaeroides TaxID=1063 RepID=UPI000191CCB6|nr:hypothetical protein [Cereibacter sphaeroides]ACM03755.1 Hypothetical Protein RSKD131_3895 [Cereibacter sphaeroides KD131]EKX56133.1 hypothetical protein D516_3320 [Rhodobacter sp. AKP1]